MCAVRFPQSCALATVSISRLMAFNSPDCDELDPNRREVRRKPKKHRAVVGFIVVLWAIILFEFTCPVAYPSLKHTESVKRLASVASSAL